MLQILVQFAGNLSGRASGKQSSLNLSIFFVFFYFVLFSGDVSEFIQLRVFFKVIFSRILVLIFFLGRISFFLGRISVVNFRLILLLFLGKLHSRSERRNPSASLSFSCNQFGPRICTEGVTSSSRQKEEIAFWCRSIWDYFSLFHSGQIKSTCDRFSFFLRNNFLYKSQIISLHTIMWFQVFPFNANSLYTIIRFQVFLSNSNNVHTITCFQVTITI